VGLLECGIRTDPQRRLRATAAMVLGIAVGVLAIGATTAPRARATSWPRTAHASLPQTSRTFAIIRLAGRPTVYRSRRTRQAPAKLPVAASPGDVLVSYIGIHSGRTLHVRCERHWHKAVDVGNGKHTQLVACWTQVTSSLRPGTVTLNRASSVSVVTVAFQGVRGFHPVSEWTAHPGSRLPRLTGLAKGDVVALGEASRYGVLKATAPRHAQPLATARVRRRIGVAVAMVDLRSTSLRVHWRLPASTTGAVNAALVLQPAKRSQGSPTPTPTPSVTPTVTPTVSPTVTPTVSPTVTPTVSPTVTPTVSPTVTPTVSPTVTPTVSPTDCGNLPSACGYPDQTNSGVPGGTTLTPSGPITVTKAGTVIADMKVSGYILVDAPNVTIKDTEVTQTTADGGQDSDDGGEPWDVYIGPSASGTIVEDSTLHGADAAANAVLYGIFNSAGSSVKALRDQFYYCAHCYSGPGTLKDSYAIANGSFQFAHIEATYYGGGQGFLTIDHDTLLAPNDQDADGSFHPTTAAVYAYSDFGVVSDLTITNSLLAGGGYTIYGGGPTAVNVQVTNNRFSRLYFDLGGIWGVGDYLPADITWTGNVWDDTLAPVSSTTGS
jgi:hypothetical protein